MDRDMIEAIQAVVGEGCHEERKWMWRLCQLTAWKLQGTWRQPPF